MPQWIQQSEQVEGDAALDRFVALQPIVDRRRETFGYELLFRSSWENRFSADGDTATEQLVDNSVAFGMESLVGAKRPFLNCTRDILLRAVPTLLPKTTVLEVLETMLVDAPLVEACRNLSAMGYAIALDDYDFAPQWDSLLPYVAFIKVDFRASTQPQRRQLMQQLGRGTIQFIAEKIETKEEYELGLAEGFHLFQGYFFTRPVVVGRRAPTGVLSRLSFMAELSRSTFDWAEILRLLKQEPSISLRLLRMANSAATALRVPVSSLRTALAMIGEDQFRKMALTALAVELCASQSSEAMRSILQNARFCELMALKLRLEPAELYLFGMVSVFHAMLMLPAADSQNSLQLRPEMIAALSGECNAYSQLLTLAYSLEQGRWADSAQAADLLRVAQDDAGETFEQARQWAQAVLTGM